MTSSGETDPGLTSLYPESDEPEEVRRVLVRHARQHELAVITDQTHYRQIKTLTQTLDKTNTLLEDLKVAFQYEKADRALQEARKEHSLKRFTALLGFGGAIAGALAAVVGAYLAHRPSGPELLPPLTPAQERAYEQHEREARHEPAPTKEFDRLIDAGR